ncbi:MAG: hypothetical protein K2G89_04405 [Lachnospiraceae bacterium]|nr:hypothetical protein [Lachnospiraceae bacterium]
MNNKLEIAKHYLYYKKLRMKNRECLERYQQRKIDKQLDFVTKNSLFYRDYAGKELAAFPEMNKKIMMEHFNELNTVGIDRESALTLAIDSEKSRSFSKTLNHITVGLSSGTSDTRGIFLVAEEEKNQWAGYILSKVLYGSILQKYKVAFFMRANSNLYEAVKSNNIRFEFFDIYKPIAENISALQELCPDILVGQPSVLLEICDYIENKGLKIRPKKVISIAEVLEERDCRHISSVFQIEPVHQVYQCTEGCLATTCKYGTIHLNEDIVYIEKEYIDDKRFIPVITDFTRRSQPIIRYRLNDILVEKQGTCPCGSCFTALERIEGREDDVFLFDTQDGQVVKVFPDFIRRVVLFSGEVENYRVLQTESGALEIYINESEKIQELIRQEFNRLAKDMKFQLPDISFFAYSYDRSKKLKRVESRRKK